MSQNVLFMGNLPTPEDEYHDYDHELDQGFPGLKDRFSYVYITLALCMFGVGGLGISGNLLSAMVLSSKPMRRCSINMILLCLCFWDIVNIVGTCGSVGSYSWVLYLITGNEEMIDYWYVLLIPYSYAAGQMGAHGSTGFTLLVTLERYVFVCKPLRAKGLITMRKTYLGAIGMTVFIILYNIPFWFEYEATVAEETVYWERSAIVQKTKYVEVEIFALFYRKFPEMVICHLIPMILLILGNVTIWRELRESNKRRKTMTNVAAGGNDAKDISMTKITMTIIGLSAISNFLHVLWLISGGDTFYNSTLSGLSNMLMIFVMVVNSSVNFLVYCGFGKNFREQLKKTFTCSRTASRA